MHDIFDCAQKEKEKKKSKEKEKVKKNQNVITWLQACYLGNMRVIWCNFIGDSHCQTNVIDDVEILFNYYLHITFSVLCSHISCTHYTQTFAKLCTYDCVLTNLAIINCIGFDV